MTQRIPEGYRSVTPSMTFKNCKKALEFYQKAFGAKVLMEFPTLDGKGTMHATMQIGDSIIMMGDEKWRLGFVQNQNGGGFEEYVLPGETVKNWSQLVTLQFLPGLQEQTNPDIFEARMKKDLARVCPDVKWESIKQDEASRLWAWSVQGCPGQPDQSELARLVSTNQGFHIVHYAIKKAPMPDDKRSLWEQRFQVVEIK